MSQMNPNQNGYFIEFRDILPDFRLGELSFACESLGIPIIIAEKEEKITRRCYEGQVSCLQVDLPNDTAAKFIAERCCTIRFIFRCWGRGETFEELQQDLNANEERIKEESLSFGNDSWAVRFYHPGKKIGYNTSDKRKVLAKIPSIFRNLKGKVDLKEPIRELVYYEDWSDFHDKFEEVKHKPLSLSKSGSEIELTPRQYLFGHIIASGSDIYRLYDLPSRPYLGTTTMIPTLAHISAVASLVKPGDLLLDPFCGSGSLLIAAASLGARVVGSDVNSDGMLEMKEITLEAPINPSSNGYYRKEGFDQTGKTIYNNFEHYQLRDLLEALIVCDASTWLFSDLMIARDYYSENLPNPEWSQTQFDAIISDPPFGRREVFISTESLSPDVTIPLSLSDYYHWKQLEKKLSEQFDIFTNRKYHYFFSDGTFASPERLITAASSSYIPLDGLVLLFLIAQKRLKVGGRLVVWLPTVSDETIVTYRAIAEFFQDLFNFLSANQTIIGDDHKRIVDSSLPLSFHFLTAMKDELHTKLSRWLCVFEKVQKERI